MTRMTGSDGSLLSEEHTAVIQRAQELGISTMGYATKRSKWPKLAMQIKEIEEAKAREGLKSFEVHVVERSERIYTVTAEDDVAAEETVREGGKVHGVREVGADIEEVLSVKEI